MKLIKQINWSLVVLWPLPSTTLCWIFRHLCSSRFIFHSLVAGCDGAIGCISISRYRSVPPGHLVPGVEAERWQVPSNIVETRGHQGGSGRKKVATPSLLPWPEPLSWLSTNIKGAGMGGRRWEFWQWSLQSSLDFWRISLTEDWTSKEGLFNLYTGMKYLPLKIVGKRNIFIESVTFGPFAGRQTL